MLLYNLHFNELNCPYNDDPLTHDILIKSPQKLDLESICEEIGNYKEQMDDWDEEDEDSLAVQFDGYGWHEKIDEALKLVIRDHPEYEIEIVETEDFSYEIN